MARASRERFQVNVTLEDEHWYLALLQVAIRDAKSVPEVVRRVIVAYLKRQLSADKKLAAAVANMEAARSDARERGRRSRKLAEVRTMTPSHQSERGSESSHRRRGRDSS
jgi:hypothetical protein